jgi:NADH-quinone oxidoreductase subunit E
VLDRILNHFPRKADSILEILLKIQKEKQNHYVSREEIKAIADYVNEPESRVYSVVSFYTLLKTSPQGKHIIQVCKDVPCYVNDQFDLANYLKKLLSIDMNQTTEDGMFTLEFTSCLGCCEQGIVMRIGDKIYGNLNKNKVKVILAAYKEGHHG